MGRQLRLSLLASNSCTRGIGIYYRSGKMGFLFVVGDREPCHKETAETIKQFIEVARPDTDLTWWAEPGTSNLQRVVPPRLQPNIA